jgi:hypothetical protein
MHQVCQSQPTYNNSMDSLGPSVLSTPNMANEHVAV